MIEKINKNFKLSFLISFFVHLIFIIILIPAMDLEYLGTEKKAESQRLRTRLVKLVKGQTIISKKKPGKKGKKPKLIKWEMQSTKIELNEVLPKISIPTISRSERKINQKPKPQTEKEEEITIKKEIKKKKHTKNKIKIKFKGDDKGISKNGDDEHLAKMLKKIEDDLNKAGGEIGMDKDEYIPSGSGLPKGLTIDEIVGGRGKTIWSKHNKMPAYPPEAQKKGWQGEVKLRLLIDKKGSVKQVFIEEKSGFPVIDKAAKSQAKNWKIYIVEKGFKISGTIKLTVTFRLK